ncbi:hypothetical protein EON83_14830 [bacterium]|nr:MAG: hypothetical protein EON83_14830 [bacterium]
MKFFSAAALRRGVLIVHLWLGLIVGIYFSIIGVTGSVLVFSEELQRQQIMPERGYVAPPQTGAQLMPLSQVIGKLRSEFPDAPEAQLGFLHPPAHDGGAYLFRLTDDKKKTLVTSVNPYTGEVIKRYGTGRTWLDWVDDVHVNLLFADPGKLANGYGGLLAGLLVLSGLWLWWPRTIRQLKIRLSVKRSGGAGRIISDLHNVFGMYPFVLLLAVTLTGSVIVFYKPVQTVVFSLVGVARNPKTPRVVPVAGAQRLSIDKLMGIAVQTAPDAHFVFVQYPTKPSQAFYAYRRSETGILPDTRIYIDPYTGKLLQVGTEISDPTGRRIMRSASGIHFGRWGSWPVKILYFFLGFIPLGLFVTGVLMYLRKRKAKSESLKRRNARLGGNSS